MAGGRAVWFNWQKLEHIIQKHNCEQGKQNEKKKAQQKLKRRGLKYILSSALVTDSR